MFERDANILEDKTPPAIRSAVILEETTGEVKPEPAPPKDVEGNHDCDYYSSCVNDHTNKTFGYYKASKHSMVS